MSVTQCKYEELKEENTELREIINKHELKIERAMSAIYQLYGGLYNQKRQNYILKKRVALLYDDEEQPDEPTEEYDIWPTTRQGDVNEERIKLLEEKLLMLETKVELMEKNTF
jgi:hypothetical protein